MAPTPGYAVAGGMNELRTRAMQETIGQSGMTPTAFAFLIPIFVVVVFLPILVIYCIRKRRAPTVTPVKRTKKPSLQRAEARERLNAVTEVSNVTFDRKQPHEDTAEQREASSSASILEKECAICLSHLHAPSPPEPAAILNSPSTNEAALRPASIKDGSNSEPEPILKLKACSHEFHAECLVSWVVLRKTSCPICRAEYISKEEMAQLDEEAELAMAQEPAVEQMQVGQEAGERRISNWQYFWGREPAARRDESRVEQIGAINWNRFVPWRR